MAHLKSMTAYARHTLTVDNDQYTWELRSVNHRYLDAHFRLPETTHDLEQDLRKLLAEQLTRGRVDVTLSVKYGTVEQTPLSINPGKLAVWLQWQQQIQTVMPDARSLSVMEILGDSGAFEIRESKASVDKATLIKSFAPALEILLEQRAAEGARLYSVLKEKLDAISGITKTLKQNMPSYQQAHQTSWQARVEKLINAELDPLRLHQEMALLISKADVAEELDRLGSHVSEFDSALQSDKPVGRRLDFLLQEFNREANTLGSKSIHQDITNASVELKVLIDQLREQVQNLE